MDDFERELMRRSPLAGCVLELCDYVLDDEMLHWLFERHRGRCYEDILSFGDFTRLMRDALLRHQGSAHKLFLELESDDSQPVDESNFYRKLARMPVAVSRALLREGTQRLRPLMPAAVATPACFESFELIIGDGKKIKNAAKRLAPTRGFSGRLIGAKALVAVDARTGLAMAMSDSLDGLTNDVPLVPQLMEQLRQIIARPICSVWDRQFDDLRTLRRLSERAGDAFVVRMNQKHSFCEEFSIETKDPQGRAVTDQIIVMGRGKHAMRLRRITLRRPGEEDVILLTNLLDRSAYPAGDLLELYRMRWGIEQVFQQVTETFSLTHLIGSAPRAVLLQFAFCLLLYNLMQVVKAYVAEDGAVLASVVSMYYLFDHARQELLAWAHHGDGSWPRARRDLAAMTGRLRELLCGVWNPILYTKAADKKPRGKPKAKLRLCGGHTSVQRALEGRAKLVTP
jgi:hypothetical protein